MIVNSINNVLKQKFHVKNDSKVIFVFILTQIFFIIGFKAVLKSL